jgi:hypothetical protein
MSSFVQIKHKKTALSNFDKEIFSNIAKDFDVKENEIEDVVVCFFHCLKESMKRGMNFTLPKMEGKIPPYIAKELRKQRIGDQKEVIKCVRFGEPINEQRMQTILLVNKIKKQNEQNRKRQD